MSLWFDTLRSFGGYNYKYGLYLQDDFVSGSTTSGGIGSLGWAASNGTTTFVAADDINHPGVLRRDTTASSGTVASLSLCSNNFVLFGFNTTAIYEGFWVFRLNNNDANTTMRIGFSDGPASSTPGNGHYLDKLDGDTNWFVMNNPTSGAGTRVDTGIAVNTNWNTLRIIATPTLTRYILNGTETQNSNTAMASTAFNPFLHIVNSAAAAKTVDLDYFSLRIMGISR